MRSSMLHATLAIAIAAAVASAQPAAPITTAEQLVGAMHDRYATSWYHTLTFVQKSTWLNPDGSESRNETWYEAISLPGRLRIDLGDPRAGNGSLYANDSVYAFAEGKLTRARAQRNALLILGFDVYAQSVPRTLAILRDEGFDLTKLHRATWQRQPVYVVGALEGDTLSKQFWIEAERLLFVRLITPNAQRTGTRDVRFNKYVRRGGGWLAEQVQDWTGSTQTFQEDYSDVQVNPALDPGLWDPKSWSTVRHWRTTSAVPRACVSVAAVPATAPDTIAESILDSLGTVDDPAKRGSHYVRNLITAVFKEGATQRDRQTAIDRICGTVIGGDRLPTGEGYYLIRLHGVETATTLAAAADTLRGMPGVAAATMLSLTSVAADQARVPLVSSCYLAAPGGRFRTQALKEMLASADANAIRLRTSLGLANVDSGTVRVVTDSGICTKVTEAVDAASPPAAAAMVYLVLRAGPRYVAFDPLGRTHALFFVDTTFRFRNLVP